ncbi:hypothetical protein Tco_0797396 [Tanacetum coccineum]
MPWLLKMWSYQAEEENPTNFSLMTHTSLGSSSSSDSELYSCSRSCVKAYATLKEQYDSLSSDYKRRSINVLKFEVKLRDTALIENKKKLEKAEKERDELKLTLEKFQNSSKSLNNLLESQVVDKFKTGLGYNAASSTAASSWRNKTNGIAGKRDNIVADPKVNEEDAEEKPTEMDECGASDKDGEYDQATKSEFERLLQQEKQTENPNSTNSINTVSTPVSTARPSCTNDDQSSLVNTAEASNAFEEHLF